MVVLAVTSAWPCYSILLDGSFSGHREPAPAGIQCSLSELCSHVADNGGDRQIPSSQGTLIAWRAMHPDCSPPPLVAPYFLVMFGMTTTPGLRECIGADKKRWLPMSKTKNWENKPLQQKKPNMNYTGIKNPALLWVRSIDPLNPT